MVLGLNFGINKSKGSSNSTINKSEQTNQQQSTNTQGTTATSQNSTTKGNSVGSSTSTQTGSTSGTSTKTNVGTGTTSLFNNDILQNLEGVFGGQLGALMDGKTNPALAGLGEFDPNAYVASSVAAAENKQRDSLDALFGGLGDQIGGDLGNSSMGMLLANRATNDAAATVEGVRANATGQAQQIANQRVQTALAGQNQDQSILGVIGQLLKGGVQASTQTGSESGSQSGTNTASGSTNTTEQTSQNTASTAMQTVQQLVNALLTGSTVTAGTESTKTKGSGMNAGASLSLGK